MYARLLIELLLNTLIVFNKLTVNQSTMERFLKRKDSRTDGGASRGDGDENAQMLSPAIQKDIANCFAEVIIFLWF
jgi:hypothetical protein